MMSSGTRKRIVLATFGSLGDLQPFLAIALALRERGHWPVIATSEIYRQRVCACGLEFVAVRPDRQPDQQDPDYLDRLTRLRQSPAVLFRQMFLPSMCDSVRDALGVVQGADAILAHPLAIGARLAAEALDVPWISAVMQPMGYLSAYEPAVVGPPGVAAAGRAAGPSLTRLLQAGARRLTGAWSGEWHALRAELGLPPVADHPLWEGQHSPLLSLGLFPRLLGQPQPDWPAQARVAGFPFYREPERTLSPQLQAFLDSGEPPLVFTLGTTAVNDPGLFYEESAQAARRLGVRAVLVVGPEHHGQIDARQGELIAVPYAPHDLLFPRALAVVHQGGIGTLCEALSAGKPMLIMPYGHDQADNAWRASRIGAARVITRKRYRAGTVSRGLARLLADSTYRITATRAAGEITRDRGAEVAALAIETTIWPACSRSSGISHQERADTGRLHPLLP